MIFNQCDWDPLKKKTRRKVNESGAIGSPKNPLLQQMEFLQ